MNGYHDSPADKAKSELAAGADTVPGYDFPHFQNSAGPFLHWCTGTFRSSCFTNIEGYTGYSQHQIVQNPYPVASIM